MSKSHNISIIEAIPSHLPGIATIENQLIAPWSMVQIEDELALAHGWQYVATKTCPDEVLGFIFGSSCADEAEIRKFAISNQARRLGYGRQLLSHSLHFLKQHEIQTCFLELRESNSAALSLYTHFGFKKIGLRKSYYSNPCEHAIILKKYFQYKGDLSENN